LLAPKHATAKVPSSNCMSERMVRLLMDMEFRLLSGMCVGNAQGANTPAAAV
jgi:hypothetical protein